MKTILETKSTDLKRTEYSMEQIIQANLVFTLRPDGSAVVLKNRFGRNGDTSINDLEKFKKRVPTEKGKL